MNSIRWGVSGEGGTVPNGEVEALALRRSGEDADAAGDGTGGGLRTDEEDGPAAEEA